MVEHSVEYSSTTRPYTGGSPVVLAVMLTVPVKLADGDVVGDNVGLDVGRRVGVGVGVGPRMKTWNCPAAAQVDTLPTTSGQHDTNCPDVVPAGISGDAPGSAPRPRAVSVDEQSFCAGAAGVVGGREGGKMGSTRCREERLQGYLRRRLRRQEKCTSKVY